MQKTNNNKNHSNSKLQSSQNHRSEKSLIKIKVKERSSTYHLNQYSKKVLIDKNDQLKRSGLLRRNGTSLSNFAKSKLVTQRQQEDKFKDFGKVEQFLANIKKKRVEKKDNNQQILIREQNKDTNDSNAKRITRTPNGSSRNPLINQKESSSGQLRLGKNIIPQMVPTKQERWNPFYEKPLIISQHMINTNGVYNLLNAGVLPKQYDFIDILNNKYEVIQEYKQKQKQKQTQKPYQIKSQVVMKIQEDTQTFMTNPTLLNHYQQHRKKSQAQLSGWNTNTQSKTMNNIESRDHNNIESKNNNNIQRRINNNKQSETSNNIQSKTSNDVQGRPSNNVQSEIQVKRQNKIRKTKVKKAKRLRSIGPVEKIHEIFVYQLPFLAVVHGRVQVNEQYHAFLISCLRQGTQVDFFQLINAMQKFCLKYNLRKVKFKPDIPFIKGLSQGHLLGLIQNHKILGYDRTLKAKQNKIESVLLRALQMRRFRKLKENLHKIQKIKKYYRIKKLYHQNIDQRYNFFKYRLGSFAEQQRKFIQDFKQQRTIMADYKPKVQIHILSKQSSYDEQTSYYKLRQRLRAHLMRLFNTEVSDIILIVDPVTMGDIRDEMQIFIKMARMLGQKVLALTNTSPNIHIFYTDFREFKISYTGRTYFGINEEIISLIRQIAKQTKPVLIPYESSKYLPFICQTLNANLFGGTFTNQTIKMIFQEEEELNINLNQNYQSENDANFKFKRLQAKQTFQSKISKLKTFQLANSIFQDKSNIYELYSKHNKLMPFRIRTKNWNQTDFYQQLAQKIVSRKQSTKWVLKLPRGKFSRGVAYLETNDLKIFQEKRKKSHLTREDINQISKLMSTILKDKIILSHPNIMQKKQFLQQFFSNQNSYVQEFIQNAHKICIFGKILPNGHFVFLGSYKKFYTNGIGFGASYPAQQINGYDTEQLKQISASLFAQNVFGYVTFEMLCQQKPRRMFYLDLTPNLQEYSSLYFLYSTLFRAEGMNFGQIGFNSLPKTIFYCPFLDNNGNKLQDIQSLLDQCRTNKIWYNPVSQQGQKFLFLKNDPSMLSLITFGNSQFQSIKLCIQAIALLVDIGGKFNQFDKKCVGAQDLKTDGLYMMDILWKLRQIRKKFQYMQQQSQQNT